MHEWETEKAMEMKRLVTRVTRKGIILEITANLLIKGRLK